MQLLDGSFPPQIRNFYPKKNPLCPGFCLFPPKMPSQRAQNCCCSSKRNPTYPGRSWRIRWNFLTWFFFAWDGSGFFSKDGFWRAGKTRAERRKRAPQANPPKDGWWWVQLFNFWRRGLKSLGLRKGQRGACAGDFNLNPKGVIYPWETKGENILHSLGTQGGHSACTEWESSSLQIKEKKK